MWQAWRKNENAYRDLVRKPKEKSLLGIPDTDRGIILKWTLSNWWAGGRELYSSGLREEQVVVSRERGSVKFWEFLKWLWNC